LEAADEVFAKIAKIIKDGNPKGHLQTRECHSGFKRLT
jgi:hypothetical protein